MEKKTQLSRKCNLHAVVVWLKNWIPLMKMDFHGLFHANQFLNDGINFTPQATAVKAGSAWRG